MQPKLELLSKELTNRILDEAFELLMNPGIKVQSLQARKLLAEGGAKVDETVEVAKIPEKLVREDAPTPR